MTTFETVITIVGIISSNIVTLRISKNQSRKAGQDYYKDLVSDLKKDVTAAETEIVNHERKHKVHAIEIKKCQETQRILRLSNTVLNNIIVNKKLEERMLEVYILDDSELTQDYFREHFEEVCFVHLKQFSTIRDIENALIEERPEILVLDYKINGTIDILMKEIMAMEDYSPTIFMISGMPDYMFERLPFANRIYKFFNKGRDETYVTEAFDAVIDHIRQQLIR